MLGARQRLQTSASLPLVLARSAQIRPDEVEKEVEVSGVIWPTVCLNLKQSIEKSSKMVPQGHPDGMTEEYARDACTVQHWTGSAGGRKTYPALVN